MIPVSYANDYLIIQNNIVKSELTSLNLILILKKFKAKFKELSFNIHKNNFIFLINNNSIIQVTHVKSLGNIVIR